MANKDYTLEQAYTFYKERQKSKGNKVLTKKEFKQIAYRCNKGIIAFALQGKHIKLPFRLGILRIVKRKVNYNNLKINFKHFNETGEKIYHLNEHSDGWYGKWHWTKYAYLLKNIICYSFTPTKTNTTACANVFFEPGGHKRFSE